MPEKEWTVFSSACPSRESLARIANKWTAMIVIMLLERPHRFSDLAMALEGISKKVLTDTLRALERDGLVARTTAGYELTNLGRTLQDPLVALQKWAETNVTQVLAARDHYDLTQEEQLLG